MGTNNPNLPSNCLSDAEALQYLASIVASMRSGLYTGLTGNNPVLTAAQMVGGVVAVSGQTAAQTVTTDTAAAIIARMQAIDANAAVGSTATFGLVNDNTTSGAVTLTAGANVTIADGAAIAIGAANRYIIKWATTTTVTISRAG